MIADLFVLACFAVGFASAFLVAFHPNILYGAVSLIFSLLSVAGCYALLGADFLAGIQLIIYVGGIIIVILFAIMMSEKIYRKRFLDGAQRFAVPLLFSASLGIVLFKLIFEFRNPTWIKEPAREVTTKLLGLSLIGPYALVFQYVVIVLLIGLIGAVVIARPQITKSKESK